MKLENYEVHLPSYSIGNAIYDKIGPACESYGRTVLIIGGKKALAAALDKIKEAVSHTALEIIGVELYGNDCTYETVDILRALPLYSEADMVFGVGGGKALDTVKCLCITDDKPVFTFPTIASNCAACTSVSIMYNSDGTFLSLTFLSALQCTLLLIPKSLQKPLSAICGQVSVTHTPNITKLVFHQGTNVLNILRHLVFL